MDIRSIAQRCILVLALLPAGGVSAAQTILDFEDPGIQTGATIDAQYGPRGVIFQNASLERDPAAHSGTRVLRTVKTGTEVFTAVPMVIRFTSAQARVKLFAGSQFASLNGTLTAFDSGGNVVAADGPRLVQQNTFTTAFQVVASTAAITRVQFQLEGTAFASIDDLEFEGEPPPPPPAQPVVQITQPVNGINVDIPGDLPRLDIAGTVTGDGLPSQVTVTVAFGRPPESATLPPLTLVLDLTGSGTTRQFSLPEGMRVVPLGPIAVTATAENIASLKGTATSKFTNLPFAVRNRFVVEGGAAALGDLQYGILGACAIAVYERGAISGRAGGATVIRGNIFTKWLSLRGPFNETGWFGCPLNEEGDAAGGSRVQPFDRGRIYARLPGMAPSRYVPAVFVDAIDKRGGEAGVGLPLADPTDSSGVMQTWLFQRFFRPDDTDGLLPSALEIRGTPPTLWIERQAGSWMRNQAGIGHAMDPSDFDKGNHKSGATLWESFSCGGNLGPCSVDPEPSFPPQNVEDAGGRFCDGTTYIPGLPGPPEWKGIRGDFVATPVFGAIVSAHMTDIDNGLTHETHNGNCPYLGLGLAVGSLLIPPAVAVGAFVAAEENGATCVSDYEFSVRPIGPQIDTSPLPSLFGKSNTENIKTEYEVAYASAAHNFLGAPALGDLVHMTGRWIIDCGHKTFKSELHPLFSFARMKTVVSETNTFTGLEEVLFGGRPATRVAIWVNGWYPGGDDNAIEFDVFPPPRPSPTSVLHVVKPVDSDAGGFRATQDVTLDFGFAPAGSAGHVHLRFTSPRRENPVTGDGEMLFGPGRQYWGIWYLFWGN